MRLWGHAVQRKQLRTHHPATQMPSLGHPWAMRLLCSRSIWGWWEPRPKQPLHPFKTGKMQDQCFSLHAIFLFCSISYFGVAPSLLDTTWSILDHGSDKYSGTEMRSMQRAAVPVSAGQLQGLESWQDRAVFPSTLPLHLSSLMSAEAATVFCERNNVTCAGTCVFAILRWVLQLLGFSLELQL